MANDLYVSEVFIALILNPSAFAITTKYWESKCFKLKVDVQSPSSFDQNEVEYTGFPCHGIDHSHLSNENLMLRKVFLSQTSFKQIYKYRKSKLKC